MTSSFIDKITTFSYQIENYRLPYFMQDNFDLTSTAQGQYYIWKVDSNLVKQYVGVPLLGYIALPVLEVFGGIYHSALCVNKAVFFTLEIPVRVLSGSYFPYCAGYDINLEVAGKHAFLAIRSIFATVARLIKGPEGQWTGCDFIATQSLMKKNNEMHEDKTSFFKSEICTRAINGLAIPILAALGTVIHLVYVPVECALTIAEIPFRIIFQKNIFRYSIQREYINPTSAGIHLRCAVKTAATGLIALSIGVVSPKYALKIIQ